MEKSKAIITVKEARKLLPEASKISDGELQTLIFECEQILRMVYRLQLVHNSVVVE